MLCERQLITVFSATGFSRSSKSGSIRNNINFIEAENWKPGSECELLDLFFVIHAVLRIVLKQINCAVSKCMVIVYFVTKYGLH